jgi:hypothetical protein
MQDWNIPIMWGKKWLCVWLEVYRGTHPIDWEHNTFSVVDRLYEPVENKGYTVHGQMVFKAQAFLIICRPAAPEQLVL